MQLVRKLENKKNEVFKEQAIKSIQTSCHSWEALFLSTLPSPPSYLCIVQV